MNDIGATVTGEGQDAGPAQRVVQEIDQANGKGPAVANSGSVASWEDAQRMVQDAIDNFGRIDIVVNNAGILRDRMFHYMSIEEWDAAIKVHLYGAFYVSRAAIPHFRKQESGNYTHITSTSGLIGAVGQVNYGAAKMGIAGLSRNIAMDMQRYNVRSNCIGPHAFSRMIETVPGQTEEQLQARAAKTRPDHIAQLIAFLATDAAAGVSGQIFGVRGNEVDLYNQPRPIRIMACPDGRTPENWPTLAACREGQLHAAGTHPRRISVGSGLIRLACGHPGLVPVIRRGILSRQRDDRDVGQSSGRRDTRTTTSCHPLSAARISLCARSSAPVIRTSLPCPAITSCHCSTPRSETGLSLMHVRHEAATVHMADAYGRLTGRPGIACVTGGPGHANAVGALFTALGQETPMVLLSDTPRPIRSGSGGFQELRQVDMAAPVCKAAWMATATATVGIDVAKAIRVATSGRPGPVHLSLPSDILGTNGD